MVEISIVIVSWNTANLLRNCLHSIYENVIKQSKGVKVYVVDNASTDESVQVVQKEFPWVNLTANEENVGFAKANNQILKKLKSEYVFILNPDTKIKKNSVSSLLKFLEKNPDAGACGSLLLNADGSIQKMGYYHKFPSLIQTLLFYTEISRFSKKSKYLINNYWESDYNVKQIQEIDQIPGACIFAKVEVLKKVGFFSEDFPIWFEDVDLCFKLKKMGYKLYIVPQSQIYHHYGSSFNKWEDEVKKQCRFFKSLFLFFDKHKNIFSRILVRFIIISNFYYLVFSKSIKQLFTPTEDRKQFIVRKLKVAKCLLA